MNILLMNGHGGNPYDSGATGNGYKEAVLTRELADLVEAKLKKYATVKRYPKDRNAFADVQAGTFASHVPGGIKNIDYAFEIHFNAFGSGAHGSECYVTSAESGITVEQAIMKNMSKFFTLRDNDSIFDGVKRTNFAVIQTCKNYGVSGALLETCFIDNADDIAVYQRNKDAIADAIVDGIAEGFGLKVSSGSKPSSGSSSSSKKTISQIAKEVINGEWGNGDARKQKLEAAGYDYAAVQAEVDRRYGVTSTTTKCDDILTVGSVVTSKPMAIKAVNGSAIKYVDGVECVNIPDLGGWFPTKYVSEYDASDGKKDNYLANTKAKVYLDNATVEAIDIPNNLAKIHGIWCKADPMIEIKEGK